MLSTDAITPVHEGDLILRLLLAVGAGAGVGWERESGHKPAGLRTHMLVSLGAAMFVLAGLQMGLNSTNFDVAARIIQGIVTGIGFLGAGEIFSKRHSDSGEIKIRGLTSAAAIWVSSSLGIAAACGFWVLCLAGTFLCIIILWGVKKIE
ncbi:MgtC/SapB family protein [Leptolyngbya sp. AN02str]|uniref:MgtC/SapB family protein n=1 Tax=Leptolyngbya sp. AN02str TaxID=3423363 RepID=UPI003D31DFB1